MKSYLHFLMINMPWVKMTTKMTSSERALLFAVGKFQVTRFAHAHQ